MGKHSFLSKPRHVTPQIDHLGKMKLTLFSGFQHYIYAVSKEIDGKTCIFRVT